jgi:MFS family permease
VVQWVTSGYLLALALMLPLNGWLVERIGAKRLYLVCFSGFTLASALCALSWSAGSLIGFRLLQGVSGGLMAPMTQLTLARVAGKHLVRVVGYAAVPVLLGPILGPVIAGAILQHATWHWLFLINLPIGILAVVLASLFLPDDDDKKEAAKGLDLIGFLLLSPGLVLFLYGSDHLGEQTGVTTILLSIILLAAFVFKASKDRQRALIDLQNVFEHCATSWRSHTDDPLRNLSRLAVGCSFARQCNQCVYPQLCPLMQLACVADCSRNQASAFLENDSASTR